MILYVLNAVKTAFMNYLHQFQITFPLTRVLHMGVEVSKRLTRKRCFSLGHPAYRKMFKAKMINRKKISKLDKQLISFNSDVCFGCYSITSKHNCTCSFSTQSFLTLVLLRSRLIRFGQCSCKERTVFLIKNAE